MTKAINGSRRDINQDRQNNARQPEKEINRFI